MADATILDLAVDTSPSGTDVIETVKDPAGTPASKQVSFANVTKALSNVVGDSGSGGVKGLVPAPGAGDAAAGKFLNAGGTYSVPTGTGVGGSTGSTDNALLRADGPGGATVQSSAVSVDDNGALTVPEIAAPSTPASGKVVLYAKSDGHLYQKDDAGTETDLTATGAGGAEIGANSDITSMDGLTGALVTPTRIDFAEGAAPGTPGAGKVSLYAKADGLLYSKDDAGTETALGASPGGSPGGSSGDIQYNNAGAFDGSQLKRIDANTLEVKNGATAQVLRLYQTDDGAGNYGRVALQIASNVYVLASEKGGGGSIRNIGIKVDTSLYEFSTNEFKPPTNGGQTLGTNALRWSVVNANQFNAKSDDEFRWNSSTRMQAPADGVLRVFANSGTTAALILGTSDTSGTRLKRNGTRLEAKLGGDSAYTQFTCEKLGVNNRAAATTLGSVTGKTEIFDAAGASLGFVPIYDSIT